MTIRTKTAVVAAVLAALTAWPLVHLWLVARFDISPWKLAGWGMYSAPRSRSLGMEVFGRASNDGPLEHLGQPSPAVREEAGRFLERYRWLRRLASSAALANAVVAAHPEWNEVKIVLFEPDLDRASGIIVMSARVHRYERTADGMVWAGEEDASGAGLPPGFLERSRAR